MNDLKRSIQQIVRDAMTQLQMIKEDRRARRVICARNQYPVTTNQDRAYAKDLENLLASTLAEIAIVSAEGPNPHGLPETQILTQTGLYWMKIKYSKGPEMVYVGNREDGCGRQSAVWVFSPGMRDPIDPEFLTSQGAIFYGPIERPVL